jgi:hypothetical protein
VITSTAGLLISIAVLIVLSERTAPATGGDEHIESERATWETIQQDILNINCVRCHATGTSFALQSGLVLTQGMAYGQLIDVVPRNAAAAGDGLKRVSSAGGLPGLEQSFLWEKVSASEQAHFYDDHPHYGAIMPLGQPYLSNGELAFIEAWIRAGAPDKGVVADPVLLADQTRFEVPEFVPLSPPEQGIQFHLGPFQVWEEDDREFLYFEPMVTEEELYVTGYEISMRPGSHHFIVYNYPDGKPTPESNVYRDVRDSQGRINLAVSIQVASLFPNSFFVGTQTPYVNYRFPPGVVLRLPAGSGFDLNSHSVASPEGEPGEVYANIYTIDRSEAERVAYPANFNNTNISLPPNETTTLSRTFHFSEARNIIQMWSHAHEKMLDFSIVSVGGERDGRLLYWTNDWKHPPLLEFDPPLRMESGEGLQMITTYHNWTDETINFGLRSTDEMQFIFYIHYPEYSPGPGAVTDEWPAEDLLILDEALLPNWRVEGLGRVELVDLAATDEVHRGNVAGSIAVEQSGEWRLVFHSGDQVNPGGYTALRFAFHPGDIGLPVGPSFSVSVNSGPEVNLLGDRVDVDRKEWQLVEIPVEEFGLRRFIESIEFSGNLGGTFYLDDIRLVAARSPRPGTAVVESQDATVPEFLSLSQNYPNPFNPATSIRFDLSLPEVIDLLVYNLNGQKVATLANGHREAGAYTIRWDGRDDHGRELASGVYLYRLQVADRVATRKLMLLR